MGQVEDIRDSLSSTMADTECGHGKMRQNAFCQRFASLFWFTVVIVILTLTITAMYTYMSSIQSTTQAVFSLNATDIGIFYAMFEVGSVLSNILTTYFLARKHIPRVRLVSILPTLSFAMVFSLAGFAPTMHVTFLPYYLLDIGCSYQYHYAQLRNAWSSTFLR